MQPLMPVRVRYHPPWRLTRPWAPRAFRSADEYCNPSAFVQAPFLGSLTVWHAPGGTWRTEACAECQDDMGPWCTGCVGCHRGPRCHPWAECTCKPSDSIALKDCPTCAGAYCPGCEPNPEKTCPTVTSSS